MIIVTVYAIVQTFQARGAPDQKAINHFAAWVSPRLMPWLEMVLALLVAFGVAQRAERAVVMHGLLIGILAGLFSAAVTIAFRGRIGLHSLLFAVVVVGMGWLGGFVGQQKHQRPASRDV